MSSLTNEQIARVFAMYMPAQVCIADEQFKRPINLIGIEESRVLKVRDEGIKLSFVVNIEHSKLLLTPLSAISDEQRLNAVLIFHNESRQHLDAISVKVAKQYIGFAHEDQYLRDYNVRQYYISEGVAVPLFIEVGHPDNGKTAIELGLAIDKTA